MIDGSSCAQLGSRAESKARSLSCSVTFTPKESFWHIYTDRIVILKAFTVFFPSLAQGGRGPLAYPVNLAPKSSFCRIYSDLIFILTVFSSLLAVVWHKPAQEMLAPKSNLILTMIDFVELLQEFGINRHKRCWRQNQVFWQILS